MNILNEVIIAISQLRVLGLVFLTVIAGAWIYDLFAWWRVRRHQDRRA
ncbi:MAG: hypothetical protein ACE5JS_16515 [Nitrospinota bacterium]